MALKLAQSQIWKLGNSYLRIVKLMYFDEEKEPIDYHQVKSLHYLLAGIVALIVFFILYPSPLVEAAAKAAKALVL